MITLNQEQRLGRAAYFLMASRRMGAGLVIILIAAVLLVLSASISNLISSGLVMANARQAVPMAYSIVMDIDGGLWIIGLLICLVGVIIARLEYANYVFTFEEFDLRLKRGILSTTTVSIPYRSMQDVDIERTIMHRLSGTSRVVIDSAGHEEKSEDNVTDIILEPINKEAAEDIRLMLQRKIGVQVVKTEQEADAEATEAAKAPKTA